MKEIIINPDFNVEDVSEKITAIMGKWSIYLLDIEGAHWRIYNYDGELKFLFRFQVDFTDLKTRIKLEDLRLNVIHYIESLKDETKYDDNLINLNVF